MKGPYERLKYDLRRLWECPVCKRRERTASSVTYRLCQCRLKQVDGTPVVMKLVEDGVQRLVPPIAIEHEPVDTIAAEPPAGGSATTSIDATTNLADAEPDPGG